MARYVLRTRYVADATRIHIISSLSVAKTYRFCRNKNIEQTEFAYRQKENKMEQNKNQLREESIEFAIAVSDKRTNLMKKPIKP